MEDAPSMFLNPRRILNLGSAALSNKSEARKMFPPQAAMQARARFFPHLNSAR